ncbi:hypothetical protein Pen02_81370 [Plantactinospora endophytica]|uniref:Uncharacterized protein n=1 Tax=Plantactinospora endophytica TaxID=673535 RepID=A0ABQ4EEP6_9ACTN|nr:hypothetical protein Pen02_81370 [Plantactinospora endophytica]
MHPGFTVFLIFSLVGLVVATFFVIAMAAACSTSSEAASPSCQLEVEGWKTMAIVTAIGSLVTMVGAVGFQVGRNVAVPPVPPIPLSAPPAMAPPPGAVRPQPAYPTSTQPVSGPGQPPYA